MRLYNFETQYFWRGPYGIEAGGILLPAPRASGIYRISVKEGKCREKLHGPTLILWYGKAENLTSRLAYFFSAAVGIKNAHSGGIRFYVQRAEHGLSTEDLEYHYSIVNDPRREEGCLLHAYVNAYYQRPYLNKQV